MRLCSLFREKHLNLHHVELDIASPEQNQEDRIIQSYRVIMPVEKCPYVRKNKSHPLSE